MRKQFRASNGSIMHLQTTATYLAVHCPGADRLELTLGDVEALIDFLGQARLELIQREAGRIR